LEEKPVVKPVELKQPPLPKSVSPVNEVSAEIPVVPPAPTEYTIHDNQSCFVEEAKTNLSVAFQDIDGQEFVRLTIAPIGKKTSFRAILNGYTEEFTSSAGVFLVQILNVDYDNKKVSIQVSRKS
jgi:hypothetical protein